MPTGHPFFFPILETGQLGKARKTRSMLESVADSMRSEATQAFLERFVTGETCELTGCYSLAVWLVSFNDQTSHWCSKHTRMHMREQVHWGRPAGVEIQR